MTSLPAVEPRPDVGPGERDRDLGQSDLRLAAALRTLLPFAGLAVIAVLLVEIAASPIHNSDTFFHIRFGEEFLSGRWSLRHPGTVSTFSTAHWVPTQWLPEVVMAQLYRWFGLAGVAWLGGVMFLALATSIFLTARRGASPAVSATVTCLTLIACSTGMSIRPQQISYLLVVVTTGVWIRAQQRRRPPWLLIPLTWVWAMCHGMWPTGILIGVVAIVGIVLDGGRSRRQILELVAVPVASLLVCFVTPVGPGLLRAVIEVNSRGKYYSEWATPSFTKYYCVALLVLVALAAVPRLRRGHSDWFSILLIGLACGWGLYSLRTVPVAACMLVPFAASGAQHRFGSNRPLARRELVGLLAGFAAALTLLTVEVPGTGHAAQPAWEDRALGSLPRGTVVLDPSGYGGYLMWRYPDLDLVMHGYGDLYTDKQLADIARIERVEPHWVELVKATDARYALVDPGSTLGYALEHVEHWTVLHHSAHLDMLQPPAGWFSTSADRSTRG